MSWNRADDGEQYEVARRLNAEAGRTWTVMWAPALRAYVAFYQGTATVRWQSAPTPQGLMDRMREAEHGLEAGRPPTPRDTPRNVGAHRRPASPRTPADPAAHDDAGPTTPGGTGAMPTADQRRGLKTLPPPPEPAAFSGAAKPASAAGRRSPNASPDTIPAPSGERTALAHRGSTPTPAADRGTSPVHADFNHQATSMAAVGRAAQEAALAHAAGRAAAQEAARVPALAHAAGHGDARPAALATAPMSVGAHAVAEAAPEQASHTLASAATPAIGRSATPEPVPTSTGGHTVLAGEHTAPAHTDPVPLNTSAHATGSNARNAVPALARTGFASEAAPAHTAGGGDAWDADLAPAPTFAVGRSTAQGAAPGAVPKLADAGTTSAHAGSDREGAPGPAADHVGSRDAASALTGFGREDAPGSVAGHDGFRNAVPALTGFAREKAPGPAAGDAARDAASVPALAPANSVPAPTFAGEGTGSGTVSGQAGTGPEGVVAPSAAAARTGDRPDGVPARAGSRVASRAALRRAGLGGDPDRAVVTARLRGPRSGPRAVVIPWEETPPQVWGAVGVEERVIGGSAS
ncbi:MULTISPECIES: hypothetical protein [unclassified Nocardiopsis]|uniref:hypothetical protein n=1 Tax=Nocardiopsis TaxID=2013 RepID=UPI00387B1642